ncbi:MAG TPA: endonuclease/exonuclease/phosphatase family protein [Ktedonobacterales bacterium]|jgi:endonuclease/exonuclease/phosphatase family metal-dependent hydrolase|nr:endonuclease/exonuclease/phosphatase family protein [Ktedonobacterales bacterium]
MFTVMTYNVGNGLAAAPSLVRYLRTTAADIVGLQELATSEAQAITEHLADLYPFRVALGKGIPGKGVLSRFPLDMPQQLDLIHGRPDLCVEADVNGLPLTVLVAHPPPPRLGNIGRRAAQARSGQLSRLADIAVARAPALLMGDFNMVSWGAGHALFTAAGLRDAFQVSGTGSGFTLPMRVGHSERLNRALGWPLLPFLRVDYIWLTSQVEVVNSWTERGAGSDHRPVLARLQLTDDVVKASG